MDRPSFRPLLLTALLATIGAAASPPTATAAPTFLGPTPYLAFDNTLPGAGAAISPFRGLSFSYFHLETFEDGLLNTPGVVADAGAVTGPGGITDSVDGDDGLIDGSGLLGKSFFAGGTTGITFTFSVAVLGTLPTHAGIVWTDGATFNNVTFQAFGPGGASLGTIFAPNIGDGDFSSRTAEDRFFGVIDPAGISAIRITSPGTVGSSGTGIEVDHLQYGASAVVTAVPEPSGVLLLGMGIVGTVGYRRYRRGAMRRAGD